MPSGSDRTSVRSPPQAWWRSTWWPTCWREKCCGNLEETRWPISLVPSGRTELDSRRSDASLVAGRHDGVGEDNGWGAHLSPGGPSHHRYRLAHRSRERSNDRIHLGNRGRGDVPGPRKRADRPHRCDRSGLRGRNRWRRGAPTGERGRDAQQRCGRLVDRRIGGAGRPAGRRPGPATALQPADRPACGRFAGRTEPGLCRCRPPQSRHQRQGTRRRSSRGGVAVERLLIDQRSEIVIDRGLVQGEVWPARPDREKVAVFTQPGARHIAEMMAIGSSSVDAHQMVLPDGEAAKTLAVAQAAYTWLAAVGIGRHDTIVGVGGGSVTDLAGFVAATYLRGIEVVHVPTTLLGAVDAAIGGKTGVNLGGKNLVGAFHHPTRVVIDLDVLDELPTELRRDGLAEALKAGLIGDASLFSYIESAGLEVDLDEVVSKAGGVTGGLGRQAFRGGGGPRGGGRGGGSGRKGGGGCNARPRQGNASVGRGLRVRVDGPPRRRVLE